MKTACLLILLAMTVALAIASQKKSDAVIQSTAGKVSPPLFGFYDSATEFAAEKHFLAIPDPKLAREHLRVLTQAPHIAGSPADKATADYVA
ncbi:MAG: glutamate carboxypeptidase, partial [Acidobacteriota bacterium]|nr:glutamate carboxypeptidase [Acidobacteriota bacterium]